MNKKMIRTWLAVAASVLLAITIYNGWILLPGFYAESHFRFDAPEGGKILNQDGVAEITLRNGGKFRILSRCHHYPFQNHNKLISENCTITVFMEDPDLKFSNHTEFAVEDTSWWNEPHRIGTLVEVFGSEHEWAQIDFTNATHPNSIRLYVPNLKAGEELFSMPAMTGYFEKQIRFDFCTITPCF